MVISGEDVRPLHGTLVGRFGFITTNVVLSSASTMFAPRLAVPASSVEKYHRTSWALKSPIMSTYQEVWSRSELKAVT